MPALAMWAAMPLPITPEPITAAFLMVMGSSPLPTGSDRFQDGGDALTAADALGGQRQRLAFTHQQAGGLASDAGTRGAQRVTQRQGAAIQVDLGGIEAQFLGDRHGLHGKRLVAFHDVDVGDGQAGAGQGLAGSRNRTVAHDRGIAARHGDGADLGHHLQPVCLGEIFGADQHGRRAVGQRRGGAGGDGAILGIEGQLQGRQRLGRRARTNAAILLHHLAVGRIDGNDLGLELAFGLGLGGLGMAFDGIGFLLGAGEAELLGQIFSRDAHRHIGAGVGGMQGRIRHRVVAAHRHAAHAFNAGGDEAVTRTQRDGAGGLMDGLHGGTAEAVDGGTGHRLRQTGDHGDDLGDVEALLTLGEGAAHHQILDGRTVHARARQQLLDHGGGQIVRAHLDQFALAGNVERGPGIAGNDDILHLLCAPRLGGGSGPPLSCGADGFWGQDNSIQTGV
eukprot:comp10274_c0_seq1/m.12359 comp10274_c0_seq1/g.12359  ORF comp10274_c0_seq1/g.12359 comp10274_c0_seq1/m.12359 type:complete len:450 (+) comp10274_c0_seq1:1102-2451(+)